MKNFKLLFIVTVFSAFSFTACEEDDSTQPTTTANNGGGTNNTDTTGVLVANQFWLNDGAVKCSTYTKTFTQFINLISVNTEKCYQEFVRPNFTFDFPNSIAPSTYTFSIGTYNIVKDAASQTTDSDVIFSMSGYNGIKYAGVSGTVVISKLSSDTTIWVAEWDKINIYSEDDSTNYTFTGRIEDF